MHFVCTAVVAEWLRRLTRNQIPFGSVGSNPTSCEFIITNLSYSIFLMKSFHVQSKKN